MAPLTRSDSIKERLRPAVDDGARTRRIPFVPPRYDTKKNKTPHEGVFYFWCR